MRLTLILLFLFCCALGQENIPEKLSGNLGKDGTWHPFNQNTLARAITAEDPIRLSIEINSPVDSVWSRWTSPEGIRKFFAPASEIEFKPLGSFNIFFNPNAPAGQRGAEGNFFLAIQPDQMLSFTWEAPPQWPEIRKQRTTVMIRFIKINESKTKVIFTQSGWGTGKEWEEVRTYFASAWGETVLPFLKYSLEVKPVDWSDFPNKLPKNLPRAQSF